MEPLKPNRPQNILSQLPVSVNDPLAYLAHLVTRNEESFDLGHAALAIASAHYVAFDLKVYLQRLDALAEEVSSRIGRVRRPERMLTRINAVLFDEMGFRGNREAYYDPSNSFLNEVLDRRVGLPISLSVVYLAIAHRLGLPIYGVALPLHFVVKWKDSEREIFIDPFHNGEVLTPDKCQSLVERIVGRPIVFEPGYLNATPKPVILYRMLNNLKLLYMRRNQPAAAGRVVEQMLVIAPESCEDIRDRGLLYLRENALGKGLEWLMAYLDRTPEASDAEAIRGVVQRTCLKRAHLN